MRCLSWVIRVDLAMAEYFRSSPNTRQFSALRSEHADAESWLTQLPSYGKHWEPDDGFKKLTDAHFPKGTQVPLVMSAKLDSS